MMKTLRVGTFKFSWTLVLQFMRSYRIIRVLRSLILGRGPWSGVVPVWTGVIRPVVRFRLLGVL